MFNLVEHNHAMELLAEFGIALLLFVVGLRLDLNLIRTMGPVALATGLGQITFTSVLVFLICTLLGMATVPAIYVAAAMSFSSTIIIVKLLSDKREIDSLHGRIAIGFLIVQDIVALLIRYILPALLFQAVYGDAEDPDFLAALPVRSVQWVVSAIPEERVNRTLAEGLRAEGFQGKLALISQHGHQPSD